MLTVTFDKAGRAPGAARARAFAEERDRFGGPAGFLADEAPEGWPCPDLADGFLLSTDNQMI